MSTLQDPTNRAASTDVGEFISDLDGGIFERVHHKRETPND